MYQKDVTQALTPSTPSGQGQANIARSNAMMAEAVLGGVKQGVSIFEDIKQGEFATQQAALAEEFEIAGQTLKAEGTAIKSMDFLNDGPPEESAVAAFKDRQKAYLEAAKQFPGKFKEMKQRSGALLKEYIAKYPGLADEFRKTSADITGIGRLDLENIRELYNDVEWLQKKQADEAAASEKQLAEFKKAFVDTYERDNPGDRLTGLRLAEQITVNEMNAYTQRVSKAMKAKAEFDEGLKRGDMQAGNIVAATKTEWNGVEANLTGPVFLLMRSKGIEPGAVSAESLDDPEVKKALGDTFAAVTRMRREYFNKRMKELQAQIGSANAPAINQAISELQAWYSGEEKKWNEKNFFMNPLSFAQTGVDQEVFGKRLTNIERLLNVTGLAADQRIRDIIMNFDPNSQFFKSAVEERPHLAKVLPLLRQAVQKASYADSAEYDSIVAEVTKAMFNQPTMPAAPKTPAERAAAGLAAEACRFDMGNLVRGTLEPGKDPSNVVNCYLQNVLRTGAGAQVAAREVNLAKQGIEKLPEQQRAASVQLFSQKVNQSIYGVNSDADIVKQRAMPSIQAGAEVLFADPRGLTPLRLQATSVVPTMTGTPPQAAIGEVAPDVLLAIDNKLRLEAEITGKPLTELRQNFMRVFNAEGMPSSTVVRQLSEAGSKSTGVSLGSKPMGSVRTEAQMKQEVSTLPPVPEAELLEASKVLREALNRKDLSPEARKQIEETLKGTR